MKIRTGFTLIELLVVIAIIAILAAILFPVFAKAREKARQSTCASNEKQIGLALIQYSQDYDENYPQINLVYNYLISGVGWNVVVAPYIKSTGVFKCPSEIPKYGYTVTTGPSYGFNWNLVVNASTGKSLNIAKESSPSVTVMVDEMIGSYDAASSLIAASDDGLWNDGGYGGWNTGCMSHRPGNGNNTSDGSAATCPVTDGPSGSEYNPVARHSDGANFLMADGHVKFFIGRNVSTGNSNSLATNMEDVGCRADNNSATLTGSLGSYYGDNGGYLAQYGGGTHCAAGTSSLTSALGSYAVTFSAT